jgi:hypothetical protein
MDKPIKASGHCAIDYAQAVGYIAVPFAFRVGGAMRLLAPAVGAGASACGSDQATLRRSIDDLLSHA